MHLRLASPTRRPTRTPRQAVEPLQAPSDAATAAAMDDAREPECLMDDLLALIEAGLVVAHHGPDGLRYTITGEEPS